MALNQAEHLFAIAAYKTPQNPVDLSLCLLSLNSPKPGSDMEVDPSPALLMLLGFPRSLCAIRAKLAISVGTDLLLYLSPFS